MPIDAPRRISGTAHGMRATYKDHGNRCFKRSVAVDQGNHSSHASEQLLAVSFSLAI